MLEDNERENARTVRGELKYTFSGRSEKKSKMILGIILVLVALQGALCVWTIKIITDARRTPIPVPRPARLEPQPVTPIQPSTFSMNFDSTETRLTIVKQNPQSALENISVQLDEGARLGSKGKGAKIEYEFKKGSPLGSWVGLEFKLPKLALTPTSKLSFWIRGDAKTGFHPKLKVSLLNDVETVPEPLTVGAFWKRAVFPMSRIPRSVRIFIEYDGKVKRGAYSLDQFEIK